MWQQQPPQAPGNGPPGGMPSYQSQQPPQGGGGAAGPPVGQMAAMSVNPPQNQQFNYQQAGQGGQGGGPQGVNTQQNQQFNYQQANGGPPRNLQPGPPGGPPVAQGPPSGNFGGAQQPQQQFGGPPVSQAGPPGASQSQQQQFGGPPGGQQFQAPPRSQGPPSSQHFGGPPVGQGPPQPQQFGGPPSGQQFGGPPVSQAGPPGSQGPPQTQQQQFNGPPGSQQFQGPPGSQAGPPGSQGPPQSHQQQFNGPPGSQQFQGPPSGQAPGSQQQFSGPPGNQGPPSGGPPGAQQFQAPPGNQGPPSGQQFGGGPPAGGQGPPFNGPPGSQPGHSAQPGQAGPHQFPGQQAPQQTFGGQPQQNGQFSGPPGQAAPGGQFQQQQGPPGAQQGGFQQRRPGPQRRGYPGQVGQFPQASNGMPPPGSGMPPPGAPGMNGFPQEAPKRKGIDPDAVPSPVAVVATDQEKFTNIPYTTASRMNPPLIGTRCSIIDDGNVKPRYIRSTLYSVPASDELLASSKIPLCLVVSPMADHPNEPVPLVSHSKEGPVRCRRCKAYWNPGIVFIDGGRRFTCNLCHVTSEVPEAMFCNLDHNGRRHDIPERPELSFGTVEYAATEEYCARTPKPQGYLFVIDVTYNTVQSGMVATVCQAIRQIITEAEAAQKLVKIGIITFDKAVHFYNLTENLAQPQMMVVSDINDMFLPLQEGLMVDGVQSREVIETLLDRLPHMFANTRLTQPAFGAAIQAATMALKDNGGRMMLFQSNLPIFGPGLLKKREDVSLLGTDKEKQLFSPQGKFYQKCATECVKEGICVDLFVFPSSYADLATLNVLPAMTGGALHRFPFFKSNSEGRRLVETVKDLVSKQAAHDAMMRLRCSTGIRATDFFGSHIMNNTTDVELAGVDSSKAIVIRIKHDDKLPDGRDAVFQAALLYTTKDGQRRIRVHTLSLGCTTQLADVFRGADVDALVACLPKMAVRDATKDSLGVIRGRMISQCVGILACYRKHCTSPNTATGQLILPECLKLLPVYMGSILKHSAFRAGSEVGSDERIAAMSYIQTNDIASIIPYFYPRVVSIFDVNEKESGIPSPMRPSYARLKEHGAYLLENGEMLFLWVGRLASATWIQQVLGAASFQSIDTNQTTLPAVDNPMSIRVRGIIDALRKERNPYMQLRIVKNKDPSEVSFTRYLVEDKLGEHMGYVEFLCHVHREIQAALV